MRAAINDPPWTVNAAAHRVLRFRITYRRVVHRIRRPSDTRRGAARRTSGSLVCPRSRYMIYSNTTGFDVCLTDRAMKLAIDISRPPVHSCTKPPADRVTRRLGGLMITPAAESDALNAVATPSL